MPLEHHHKLEVACLVLILNRLSSTPVEVSLELPLRTSQQRLAVEGSLGEAQLAPVPALDFSARLKLPTLA